MLLLLLLGELSDVAEVSTIAFAQESALTLTAGDYFEAFPIVFRHEALRIAQRCGKQLRRKVKNLSIFELPLNRWLLLDEITVGYRLRVTKADAAQAQDTS